jgi:hypothetical protein
MKPPCGRTCGEVRGPGDGRDTRGQPNRRARVGSQSILKLAQPVVGSSVRLQTFGIQFHCWLLLFTT